MPSDASEDITALLRARYDQDGGTDVWHRADFLHGFGSVRAALLHSALFLPELVEVDGLVFLKTFFPGVWDEAKLAAEVRARRASPDELLQFMRGFNWVEVPYLFADRSGSDEEDAALARLMAEAWRARLKDLFPKRRFDVRLLSPEETGSVIGVGFEELPGAHP
jgi:hypothetical protein